LVGLLQIVRQFHFVIGLKASCCYYHHFDEI
jgi:hypothetical protein